MKLKHILPLTAIALLASCRTDELCTEHPHGASVTVAYDWSHAPAAQPEGMRLWLYPLNITEGVTELRDITGTEGGEISGLLEGRYHIISHNNDTESIVYTGRENHGAHRATTRDTDILEPMSRAGEVSSSGIRGEEDERVAATPEPMWLATATDVTIRDGGTVTLSPAHLHCRYTYEFVDVGPLHGVSMVSASISGMSAGILLSDGSHTGEVCTHPLEAEIDYDDGRIHGEFWTFGYAAGSGAPHRMGLYVIMNDGQKFKYTEGAYLDVTDQIGNAADPREVHIVIRGLELPAPVSTGGFDPTVSDWEEEHRDIGI